MPAIAQDVLQWRMVTTWPKNFPGLGVGAQRLADRITKASGGRLNITVYSAGELVPALRSLDAVIDGSAEMSHGAAYYWQNKSQGLAFFTGVPYGMTSRELTAWVRYLGGQEVWDKIYDQFGVQGFLSRRYRHAGRRLVQERAEGRCRHPGPAVPYAGPGRPGLAGKLGASVTNMAAGDIFARAAVGYARCGRIRRPLQRSGAWLLPDLQELLFPELHRAGAGDRTGGLQGQVPGSAGGPAGDRPVVLRRPPMTTSRRTCTPTTRGR